jgi:hypothetical protein
LLLKLVTSLFQDLLLGAGSQIEVGEALIYKGDPWGFWAATCKQEAHWLREVAKKQEGVNPGFATANQETGTLLVLQVLSSLNPGTHGKSIEKESRSQAG